MENREKICAVKRMQAYIECHVREAITMAALARQAGYSQWHSARIFKEITGITPFAYIRALRLARAAEALREGNAKIVDVAFDFAFDSHEGFTRAFSKAFGMTPRDYGKKNPAIRSGFLPTADNRDETKAKGGRDMKQPLETVFIQVVDRPGRKLILKRGKKAEHYYAYCEEVGCEVWDILGEIKEALYEPIGMWLPERLIPPGTSRYVQGVEVPGDFQGEAPPGFEIIDLPPCQMMVFQGPPFDEEKFASAIDALWDVMKRFDPQIYGFAWADEDGPRFQLAPLGERGYIEGRPVRRIQNP